MAVDPEVSADVLPCLSGRVPSSILLADLLI